MNYTISYHTYPCGGVINNEMGTILTPNYPNKYGSSLECAWLLNLPKEQNIKLKFNDLNLDSCDKSYIDIYNGNSPKSPKIGRYCQKNVPEIIQTQENSVWIDYKANEDSESKGFSLSYEPAIKGWLFFRITYFLT